MGYVNKDREKSILLKMKQLGVSLELVKVTYKGELIEVVDQGDDGWTYRIGGPGKKISDYFPTKQAAIDAGKRAVDSF